jgi:hypothetical protein
MRKILSVCTVIVLLSLLIVSHAISLGSANPWTFSKQINPPSDAIPPIISITSPQNNNSYSGTFNISFTIKPARYSGFTPDIIDISYSIDNESVTVPHYVGYLPSQFNFSFVAPILTGGNHTLIVKSTGIEFQLYGSYFFMEGLSQVYFVTHEAPSIELLTDQSGNMTFSSFPLNFTVDQPTSWLGYSLDNLANVTVGGNATLTGLNAGNHSLLIFGNNTFGDMAKSVTINFTAKEPETSLALTVIAPVIFASIISLGLLVYFGRRKGKP